MPLITFPYLMTTLSMFFVGMFAFCFLMGAFILFVFNQFSNLKTKLKEAKENISLFWDKRLETVETLQSLAGQIDEALAKDARLFVEMSRGSHPSDDVPGQGLSDVQPEQVLKKILQRMRSHELNSQLRNALDLMERTETELNGSRRYYNALVREHNIKVNSFPSALVAILFRFTEMEFINTSKDDSHEGN